MRNNQKPLTQDQEEESPSTPGNSLRRLRRETDLSIEAVSAATKISINNIRAIEEENYEKLPADTFARGLVTLYGDFLGTNGSKIASEFLAERERTSLASGRRTRVKKTIYSSSLNPGKLAEPSHVSSATVALILLVTIALSFTGFCLYTSWNPFSFISQQTENMQTSMQGIFNSNKQQEVDDETTPHTLHEQQGNLETERGITEKPTAGAPLPSQANTTGQQLSYNLSALFLRDCEVVIKIDGRDPARNTFKKGERGRWRATDSLQVVFNKPEAATLTLNDTTLNFPVPAGNQLPTLVLPNDLLDQ